MDFAAELAFIAEEYLFWVLPFLFVLTVVVFFHELGHFLVARWCGVSVQTFSIGFGREIFGFYDSKGTRWRIAWIPLGGYVKFVDDENIASLPDRDKLEHMTPEQRSGTFHDKPLPARAAVVAAGPIANFILAIVIFAAMFTLVGERFTSPVLDVTARSVAEEAGFRTGDEVISINGDPVESFEDVHRIISTNVARELDFTLRRNGGEAEVSVVPQSDSAADILGLRRYTPAEVDQVEPGSPADKAGFRPGDVVTRIDGAPIETFGQMQDAVGSSPGESLSILVLRDGAQVELTATPEKRILTGPGGETVEKGLLGIRRDAMPGDGVWKRYDPLTAIWMGAERTWFVIATTMTYLYDVVTGRQDADQLGGPIRIAKVSGEVAKAGFLPLINLAALLSVSIGLLNLFPIPMLDGGHLLYYAIEGLRGRPLSERAQEIGFRIGLALVLMLMIWATRNDLIHIGNL